MCLSLCLVDATSQLASCLGLFPHPKLTAPLCSSSLATVAGTQEPIYGPTAIQSVAKQAAETSYTELTKEDLKWRAMQSTCVETQTFYFLTDQGDLAFL